MADEGFLRRWSRRKTETKLGLEPAPEPQADAAAPAVAPAGASAAVSAGMSDPAPGTACLQAPAKADQPGAVPAIVPAAGQAPVAEPPAGQASPRLPTMDDVAQLTPDSDFSAFVARGVDQAVRRSALKKLFADPHFNVMDRLDIYIDDYNKPSPMPEGMLDALKHANSFFQRVAGEDGQAAVGAPPAVPHTDAPHVKAPDIEAPHTDAPYMKAPQYAGTGNTEVHIPTITTPESETR